MQLDKLCEWVWLACVAMEIVVVTSEPQAAVYANLSLAVCAQHPLPDHLGSPGLPVHCLTTSAPLACLSTA